MLVNILRGTRLLGPETPKSRSLEIHWTWLSFRCNKISEYISLNFSVLLDLFWIQEKERQVQWLHWRPGEFQRAQLKRWCLKPEFGRQHLSQSDRHHTRFGVSIFRPMLTRVLQHSGFLLSCEMLNSDYVWIEGRGWNMLEQHGLQRWNGGTLYWSMLTLGEQQRRGGREKPANLQSPPSGVSFWLIDMNKGLLVAGKLFVASSLSPWPIVIFQLGPDVAHNPDHTVNTQQICRSSI